MSENKIEEAKEEMPAQEPPQESNGNDMPPKTETEAQEGQSEDAAQEDQTTPEEEKPSEEEILKARVTELEEALKQGKDGQLRLMAEMENLRKRMVREKERAKKFAVEGFAKELLSVADNMERALGAVESSAALGKKEQKAIKPLQDGVIMIQNELRRVFEKNGIVRIEALQKAFDPNWHQAMTQIEDDQVDAGTVVQEMQTGYALNGRLLRPAMVAISKKPEVDQSNEADEEKT
ncbi:nucleotide exchange factor GrpE [Magnetococcales bacterium HHB-1]